MNVEKQIIYWKEGAKSNIETAVLLIENNKYLEGLFFCHLTIEKILKALVVKHSEKIPPKTHNLLHLVSLSRIDLSEQHRELLSMLTEYQLEGRYPELYPEKPNKKEAARLLSDTQKLLQWLSERL